MPKYTRRTVILAKAETVYGSDPTPTGAANAILVDQFPVLTNLGDTHQRNVVRDTFSPEAAIIGAKEYSIEFEVEAKGKGLTSSAANPPEYDPLLRACGLVGAVDGNDYVYSLTSDRSAMSSATIYFYRDGLLHKLLGCRGSMQLNLRVGEIPRFRFNMRGLWATPTDTAIPGTVTTYSALPPRVVNIGLALNLGGAYSPLGVSALAFDLGNQLARRMDVNAAEGITGIEIVGRRPTGSFDPEVDTLANFDPFAAWKNSTGCAFSCTVGTDAGNQFGISIPAGRFEGVGYGDEEGVLTYQIPFLAAKSSTNDDEFALTFYGA